MIYFDNAATAGKRPPEVGRAMLHALEDISANPGRSAHRLSLEAARLVAGAREALAKLIHAPDSSHVIMTKNATEAINLVLFGSLRKGDRVLAGLLEHNAVMRPLRHLERSRGVIVEDLPGTADRPVDLDRLKERLGAGRDPVRLVAITAVSNVTGEIMPVSEVAALCERAGVSVLVDGAQGAGVVDLDVGRDPIDALALTGHKGLLGPAGTGALYVRDPEMIAPLLHGGTGSSSAFEEQPSTVPDRYEAGTLNIPGIAGLRAGIEYVMGGGIDRPRRIHGELLSALWTALRGLPGVRLFGPGAPESQIAIASFTVEGRETDEIARDLDRAGVLCRAGLQCAPRAHRTLGTFASGGTLRFSLSCLNTRDEIDEAIGHLRGILRR